MLVDAVTFRPLREAAAAAPLAFAHVEVSWDAGSVLEAWADLEASAPCSIYQTRAWLLPWIETLGRKAGLEPLFVVARRASHRPAALLCLGIARHGPVRIATWLGGFDSNFNMPLASTDVVWTKTEVLRLLQEASKACGRKRPDLFTLVNQPFEWGNRANPLTLLAHRPSPSPAFGTTLPADAETLFAQKLSKDARRKFRKKEAKLGAIGPISHRVVADADEQRRTIDKFIEQKVERLRAQKVRSNFDSPEMRTFIETASRPGRAGLELHILAAGERIVAIYGGGAHDGQWSGMFNSFDGDKDIAKSSPGDLLLMRIMTKACADGLTRFDLGIGQARYKTSLCDERIPLFDAVVPISLAGKVAARLVLLRQSVKRAVKANPRAFSLAKAVRFLGT